MKKESESEREAGYWVQTKSNSTQWVWINPFTSKKEIESQKNCSLRGFSLSLTICAIREKCYYIYI